MQRDSPWLGDRQKKMLLCQYYKKTEKIDYVFVTEVSLQMDCLMNMQMDDPEKSWLYHSLHRPILQGLRGNNRRSKELIIMRYRVEKMRRHSGDESLMIFGGIS